MDLRFKQSESLLFRIIVIAFSDKNLAAVEFFIAFFKTNSQQLVIASPQTPVLLT
jgi:hypothetical protein